MHAFHSVLALIVTVLLLFVPVLRAAETQYPDQQVAGGGADQVGAETPGAPTEAQTAAWTVIREHAAFPEAVKAAMTTVIRQHPETTRWSGQVGEYIFAAVVLPLPQGTRRESFFTAYASRADMTCSHELLLAKGLRDVYGEAKLDDLTTLRAALQRIASDILLRGERREVLRQTSIFREQYVVALAVGRRENLRARLIEPATLTLVKDSYMEVMHGQARNLMTQENWKDAVGFWHHLHSRKMVSPELYLDAATCFVKLEQHKDALIVLKEALDVYEDYSDPLYFERAGLLLENLPEEQGIPAGSLPMFALGQS